MVCRLDPINFPVKEPHHGEKFLLNIKTFLSRGGGPLLPVYLAAFSGQVRVRIPKQCPLGQNEGIAQTSWMVSRKTSGQWCMS